MKYRFDAISNVKHFVLFFGAACEEAMFCVHRCEARLFKFLVCLPQSGSMFGALIWQNIKN